MSLQQAIQAIKSGDRQSGYQELVRILEAEPNNAMVWIWLSACYDDTGKRKECLESALKVDPTNKIARQGLDRLQMVEEPIQSNSTPLSPESAETDSSNSGFRSEAAQTEKVELQYTNLAWICPTCNSRNMTSIVLRTRTILRCSGCNQEYDCLNGEAVWGQCNVDSAVWSQWFDWIVRLQQTDGSIVEVGFTLHAPDFTIAGGDFLVVLMKSTWSGHKVVQVENKTTGNIIRPGK